MILYFSGTGNSGYVAKRIASALNDELFCMNDAIKFGESVGEKDYKRLIFVTPTYAWRVPRIVSDLIEKTEFKGNIPVWFVMTCGGEVGNAAKYNIRLCKDKAFKYMGTAEIVMPENYIAMFDVPSNTEAKKIVEQAEQDILKTIDFLESDRAFLPMRNNLYDRFLSGPVNPVFYSLCVKSDKFYAGKDCIGCGRCAELCPLNNIKIENNKPVWGKTCTHCMACICYCPTSAIEYGKKSVGKPRYHIEAVVK